MKRTKTKRGHAPIYRGEHPVLMIPLTFALTDQARRHFIERDRAIISAALAGDRSAHIRGALQCMASQQVCILRAAFARPALHDVPVEQIVALSAQVEGWIAHAVWTVACDADGDGTLTERQREGLLALLDCSEQTTTHLSRRIIHAGAVDAQRRGSIIVDIPPTECSGQAHLPRSQHIAECAESANHGSNAPID